MQDATDGGFAAQPGPEPAKPVAHPADESEDDEEEDEDEGKTVALELVGAPLVFMVSGTAEHEVEDDDEEMDLDAERSVRMGDLAIEEDESDFQALTNETGEFVIAAAPQGAAPTGTKLGVGTEVVEGKLVVASVAPGSGAAKAGLQPKDVIVSVDGNAVATTADLKKIIESRKPGDKVGIVALRDGKELPLEATLGAAAALSLEAPASMRVRRLALAPPLASSAVRQELARMRQEIAELRKALVEMKQMLHELAEKSAAPAGTPPGK